ncbi:MAG: sugar phosphate isomerase/epimerase [Gemmatimonadota bacterium]|nr:sugar phosphate isomerase/epimerase [Gemmatimonadota bacterium]
MYLSCCIWALSDENPLRVKNLSDIGFRHIDIRATDFQDQTGTPELPVSCVGLSFGIPDGYRLDDLDSERSMESGAYLLKALEHAVWADAGYAYVVPEIDSDPGALFRFAGHLVHLADRASEFDIKVCIEHFPGRSLPTVLDTLSFIQEVSHPNLYLLRDTGHAQISGEDPSEAIIRAGDRLGYVHFDDNDGVDDLHLGLCDGILTDEVIRTTLNTLHKIGYGGGVSLEFKGTLPDPVGAIKKSRDIVLAASNNTLQSRVESIRILLMLFTV